MSLGSEKTVTSVISCRWYVSPGYTLCLLFNEVRCRADGSDQDMLMKTSSFSTVTS